jgi:hypothetical protein
MKIGDPVEVNGKQFTIADIRTDEEGKMVIFLYRPKEDENPKP